jgi:hypothetical protein
VLAAKLFAEEEEVTSSCIINSLKMAAENAKS